MTEHHDLLLRGDVVPRDEPSPIHPVGVHVGIGGGRSEHIRILVPVQVLDRRPAHDLGCAGGDARTPSRIGQGISVLDGQRLKDAHRAPAALGGRRNHSDRFTAHRFEPVDDIALGALEDGHGRDHRTDADNYPERGQQRAQQVRPQPPQSHNERLDPKHGFMTLRYRMACPPSSGSPKALPESHHPSCDPQ